MPPCASQGWCSQSPCPRSRPLLTHACAGDTQTLKGRSGSVSCGCHCSIPWVLVYLRSCLHPPSISSESEIWFYIRLHPSYYLVGASPLPLDVEYLFLVGSNILLLMIVQWRVVNLECSQETMSIHPSTLQSCVYICFKYASDLK